MKNQTTPIQSFRERYEVISEASKTVTIELGPNEFTDTRDRVGLLNKNPDQEPYTFLSVESKTDKANNLWRFSIVIELSNLKHTYERSVYTFMTLLGDIGGLYGAIVSIPSLFISRIIERLFTRAFFSLMPVKKEASPNSQNSLKEKLFKKEIAAGKTLTLEDV